jgi:hypothetical protein
MYFENFELNKDIFVKEQKSILELARLRINLHVIITEIFHFSNIISKQQQCGKITGCDNKKKTNTRKWYKEIYFEQIFHKKSFVEIAEFYTNVSRRCNASLDRLDYNYSIPY